jgi:hypothetical protein
MKKSVWILGTVFVLSFIYTPLLADAKQFLCVTEKSSGFSYNRVLKQWDSTVFKSSGKYIVSKSKDSRYTFQVIKVGEKLPTSLCKKGFDEYGYLNCKYYVTDFFFNKFNLRFLLTYSHGYVNVLPSINETTDEKSSTPYMEIGVCSPL